MAIEIIKTPRRGWLAIAGAVGFWAANIAIMWASFEAFGLDVSGAVVVQGFFVGMAANLIPGAPGGVGAVDAGMIGTYVLFGLDGSSVFAAVLMYRFIAFWLPAPPGDRRLLPAPPHDQALGETTSARRTARTSIGALAAGAGAPRHGQYFKK